MPVFCAVVGCGSRGNRDKRSFFRIPALPSKGSEEFIQLSKERREKWILALNRRDLTDSKIKNARICDRHFIKGRPADLMDTSSPDWIPSVVMGYKGENISLRRYNQKLHSEASTTIGSEASTIIEVECILSDDGNVSSSQDIEDNIIDTNSIGMQTDLTMEYINKMQQVINQQTEDIVTLKEKLNYHIITEESFKDDKKTKFYTGLENFQTLMLLFNFISKDLTETSRSCLTKFQQFVLTLQRLRLNLSLGDLAYRYGTSWSTASRAFQSCLYTLYQKLERFVEWPEREILIKTMPSVFLNAFGKRISIIIHCIEIKQQKPSNFSSSQVWSNYEHYQTTKFLVGICPQGAIIFISDGWDGRASDQEIALNCGILDKLLPGDVVLSCRSFLKSDEVGLYCAEVQMPCFTQGTKQLSPFEMENRKISHLRTHVEKVVGSLRQKFQILQSVLTIHVMKTPAVEDVPSLTKQIVRVCCGLFNICPTEVPLDSSTGAIGTCFSTAGRVQ